MRQLRSLLILCLWLPVAINASASETPAEHAANVYAQQELDAAPKHGNIPDYSLSPEDLAKSQHLNTIHVTMHFVDEAWSIISLLLLLWLGVIAWMRNIAVRRFPNSRWAQGFLFFLLYLFIDFFVSLPFELYLQHLSRQYGLSVQSWPSWLGDAAKSIGLTWIIGGLLVMLLFWIIRKSPRRWWLVFWTVSIPIILFGIYASPYVEPLFNKYEPLARTNPALVTELEKVVAKTHMDIPPERMFLMKASEKGTTLNADVEGFGASKRVVVWDNTIAKATPDEIMGIFGHESGHYALGHIEQLVLFFIGTAWITLYLGYRFVQWGIAKFGAKWGVPAQTDWAALAVLLLAFNIFGVITEPVQSTLVRMHEKDADVYGQEVIHGLVADPQQTMQAAFDVLGKVAYSDPNPSPLYEFWAYSHPGVGRRAAFAKAYDPWAPGMEPKYFKK